MYTSPTGVSRTLATQGGTIYTVMQAEHGRLFVAHPLTGSSLHIDELGCASAEPAL